MRQCVGCAVDRTIRRPRVLTSREEGAGDRRTDGMRMVGEQTNRAAVAPAARRTPTQGPKQQGKGFKW